MRELTYNVDFEIAAIVFLVVFEILVSTKKQIKNRQNIMYKGMIVSFLVTNFLELLSCTLNNYYPQASPVISYAINILMALCFVCLIKFFLFYVISIIRNPKILKSPVFWILMIPSLLYVLVVLSTPATHFIFWITENNRYIRGSGYFLSMVITAYNLIYAFVLVTFFGKKLSRRKRMACQSFCFLIMIGCLAQWLLVPHIIVIPLFEIVAILILHFSIQSPEYYIDKATDAFNEQGFIRMVTEKLELSQEFSIVTIAFDDFPVSGNTILEQRLLTEICKFFADRKGIYCFCKDREIYLYCKDHKIAEKVAGDVIERTKEVFLADTVPCSVKAKVLIMHCPEDLTNINDILAGIRFFSRQKMEYGKIYYYAGGMMQKSKRYEGIRNILMDAIRNDGIEMYYQPIYSVKSGKLDSAEALVRLKDKVTYGYIPPDEFIHIAEEENLILPLEELILEHVCRFVQTENLVKRGIRYIEINLSGKQCEEKHLAYKLASVVEKCNIPANFVNFEITETAALEANQHLLYNMEKLIDQGYSFSLDDFGSGYSNLQNLSKLPLKIAKLDKSLIWSYFEKENEKSKSVLIYAIKMLQELGLEIVAEGVETKEQKEELIQLNVHHLQGYYFSKPVPENEFLEILNRQERLGTS